jgi:1-phosphofructokinase family hexose kinase
MIVTVTLNCSVDRTVEVPGAKVGKLLTGRLRASVPAGKGVNLSNILAVLGTPSVITGFAGERELHRFRKLEKETGGLIRCEVVPIRGETRISTTIIDPGKKEETHIKELGPAIEEDEKKALEKKLCRIVRKGDFVVFAGSPARHFFLRDYRSLLGAAKKRMACVGVDANPRWLKQALKEKVRFIKPNREELTGLVGKTLRGTNAVISASRRLLSSCGMVIVSLGASGALLVTRNEIIEADAPRVKAVSTVGAGDAFLAGFLDRHVAGKDNEEALRWAVACGSASVAVIRAGWISTSLAKKLYAKTKVLRVPR